jgi:lactate dehydrogenase-like 2-hydroxyacid dehydrogenase
MKHKVAVTREVFDETLAYLAQHVEVTSNQSNKPYGPDGLAGRLQGMDGAVIMTVDKVDDALLSRCPQLKAVCSASVGYNHIDLAACTRHGVMVTNTPGVLTDSVADFAICLTLATCRRLTEAEAFLRSGAWAGTHLKEMLGVDLHHATVGICGFGRIGQAIAQRLRGFQTKLLYTTRTRLSSEVEQRFDVTYAAKDDLLRRADIVVLILPYTPETHHYIGERELGLMKPLSVLINVARGGVVDDAALVETLKARRIFAAGLDVYENEPKFNPDLLQLTNVVLAPHISSASEPTRQAMAMTAAKNCVAALTTGAPPQLLNPEVSRKGARV